MDVHVCVCVCVSVCVCVWYCSIRMFKALAAFCLKIAWKRFRVVCYVMHIIQQVWINLNSIYLNVLKMWRVAAVRQLQYNQPCIYDLCFLAVGFAYFAFYFFPNRTGWHALRCSCHKFNKSKVGFNLSNLKRISRITQDQRLCLGQWPATVTVTSDCDSDQRMWQLGND
jgi:hypothetical protein